jgi:ion channel-forming bestrophin family protein
MIHYNPKKWFSLIFQFHKSDTFSKLSRIMVGLAIYTFIVCYIEIEHFQMRYSTTPVVHSLLGFVISLLLVFRTNTAYERWWEGRKLWGSLLNVSRNLTMKWVGMIPKSEAKSTCVSIINYAVALKEHLRGHQAEYILKHKDLMGDAAQSFKNKAHIPNAIASQMHQDLIQQYKSGNITGEQLIILSNDINQFTDICGACERIKRTPIPYSYSLFIKKFIFMYIVTLPYSFVGDFKYWTILITVFVFYVLTSLELIAEEIEDPFGTDANDLPTDEIAANIKRSVVEISGLIEHK